MGLGESLPNTSELVPGSDAPITDDGGEDEVDDAGVNPEGDTGVTLARGDDTAAYYVSNGNGTYQTPAGSDETLVQNTDGTYTLSAGTGGYGITTRRDSSPARRT